MVGLFYKAVPVLADEDKIGGSAIRTVRNRRTRGLRSCLLCLVGARQRRGGAGWHCRQRKGGAENLLLCPWASLPPAHLTDGVDWSETGSRGEFAALSVAAAGSRGGGEGPLLCPWASVETPPVPSTERFDEGEPGSRREAGALPAAVAGSGERAEGLLL